MANIPTGLSPNGGVECKWVEKIAILRQSVYDRKPQRYAKTTEQHLVVRSGKPDAAITITSAPEKNTYPSNAGCSVKCNTVALFSRATFPSLNVIVCLDMAQNYYNNLAIANIARLFATAELLVLPLRHRFLLFDREYLINVR